jgi:hypothetical protein
MSEADLRGSPDSPAQPGVYWFLRPCPGRRDVKDKEEVIFPVADAAAECPTPDRQCHASGLQVVIEELRRTISCIVQKHEHDHH